MAWVVAFETKSGNGKRQPTDVTASIKVFESVDGAQIVQIDTGGSTDRENPGKQSQTLQLGRDAAEQLYRILRDTYEFRG